MSLTIEKGMTLICWGRLHSVNVKHSKFVRFLGFISGQESGATTGVVLSSPPSTVGYHDTVSYTCSCKCKVWFSFVSGSCPLLFILVFHSNYLVVKVRPLTCTQQRTHRSLNPVDRIDPCTVVVLPNSDGVHFFMMRDKGTDRTLPPP